MMTCVGVVVTFNRKDLLLRNLDMLSKQSLSLDKVMIIDNHSTDGTKEEVLKLFDNKWIDYRYMNSNYGGAGGFYYGVKFASELNYDLIWLMDDDGRPFNEYTFENLISIATEIYKINKKIFLNSLVTFDGTNLSFGFWPTMKQEDQLKRIEKVQINGLLYDKANPFNGTLISKDLVDKIGYPRKEFFMSRDETDYLKRSLESGAFVATVLSSIYYHPVSKLKYRKIGNVYSQIYEDLDKEYYFIRNLTYTYKSKKKTKILGFGLIRIFTILLYENNKAVRIKQLFKSISDGINNKMGRR